METLLIFALVGALTWYWYDTMQGKTLAVNFARRECQREGVQLLDQTVQKVKISMSRDAEGTWRIWREYRFEYSVDGVSRNQGRLVLLGNRLIRSSMETSPPVIH